MAIIKTRKSANYTLIHNGAAQDPNLSAKAKGILLYLMSLPSDWEIYKTELHKHFKDGRDAIINGFNELIKNGYAIERKTRNKKGQFVFEYLVSDVKFTDEEIKEFQGVLSVPDFPLRKNRNGKSGTKNKIQTKKHKQKSMYVGIQLVFQKFEEIFELTKYAKKHLERMTEEHGEAYVIEAIKRAGEGGAKRPIRYIERVLENWEEAGLKTIEDIQAYEAKHREEQKKKKQRVAKASGNPIQNPAESPHSKLPKAILEQMEQAQKEAAATAEEDKPLTEAETLEEKQKRIQAKIQMMRA